jgi:hypothetical protein
VTDIVTFGSDQPRRPPPRWLIVVGVVVLAAAALTVTAVLALGRHGAPAPVASAVATPPAPTLEAAGLPCPVIGRAQTPAVTHPPAGLLIDRATGGPGTDLERCDRAATDGQWTVVVRRPDGSLGRHGAVVTFPVGAPTATRRVDVGPAIGREQPGAVTWPVAGAYARVRGDLAEPELIAIAARTTVTGGRPSVSPPRGYRVVSAGPYRAPALHEVRYGSGDLAEQAALGNGLTYTGVVSGGGFEDQLYAVHTDAGGLVGGRPAVLSSVSGGNATLAWEPAPGVVAYVGYSGAGLDDEAVAALRRLAGRTRTLTTAEWRAMNPQTFDQPGEPG